MPGDRAHTAVIVASAAAVSAALTAAALHLVPKYIAQYRAGSQQQAAGKAHTGGACTPEPCLGQQQGSEVALFSPVNPQKRPDPYDVRPRNTYLCWDDYFMAVAFLSAERSKDPNKQVGACIVNDDNIILSIGYNGFPRGCPDALLPWSKRAASGSILDTKYPYVVHAEANALLNKNQAHVTGARIYVTLFPCNECAKLLIQAGIKEVVYHEAKLEPTGKRPGTMEQAAAADIADDALAEAADIAADALTEAAVDTAADALAEAAADIAAEALVAAARRDSEAEEYGGAAVNNDHQQNSGSSSTVNGSSSRAVNGSSSSNGCEHCRCGGSSGQGQRTAAADSDTAPVTSSTAAGGARVGLKGKAAAKGLELEKKQQGQKAFSVGAPTDLDASYVASQRLLTMAGVKLRQHTLQRSVQLPPLPRSR